MIDRLPFEANCVVIGDDENLDVARDLGFPVVEAVNDYVGHKFNVGYQHAVKNGATHCMPIGSDSWLHEDTFDDAPWEEKRALGLCGLSSFSPDGQQRVDLRVKYPAGFGVGMVYPAWAAKARQYQGQPSEPKRNRGIDNSTWARIGKGKVQIEFLEIKPQRYINFHSVDESITDFRLLTRNSQRVLEWAETDATGVLHDLYDADLVEGIERMYALRSLEVFITGKRQVFRNRFGREGRKYPEVSGRRGSGGRKLAGVADRYPNVGLRGRSRAKTTEDLAAREYEQIEERRDRKRRGLTLSRDEEMSIRFAEARGF